MRQIILSALLAACVAASYAQPDSSRPADARRPMPDPAVIEASDGTFYVFATGQGLPVYHSANLVDWVQVGRVFKTPVPEWAARAVPGTRGIWAPDIVKLGDRYCLYYSVSTFGSQRSVIGMAVNKTLDHTSPDYQWVDEGLVIESFPDRCNFNAIDPAVFQCQDGRTFMVWGSYWTGLKMTQINPQTGKPLDNPPQILDVAARPDNPAHAIEGAYVIYRSGFYYLFVSFDSCCDGAESTYKVMIGRSQQPQGPYEDFKGRPMLQGGGTLLLAGHDNWRGPGHNSVLTTEQGCWLVHHTYDTFHLDSQRIIQVRPLYWAQDGWPVAGEPLGPGNPMKAPKTDIKAAQIIGSWRLSADYGDEKIIDFLPSGRVAHRKEAKWSFDGSQLTVFLPGIAADSVTCFVEPSGSSFIGRDSQGVILRAKRLNP